MDELYLPPSMLQGVTVWAEVMKGLDLVRERSKDGRKLGAKPCFPLLFLFIVQAAVRTGSVAEFNLTPSAQGRSVCTGVCCFAEDEGGC